MLLVLFRVVPLQAVEALRVKHPGGPTTQVVEVDKNEEGVT